MKQENLKRKCCFCGKELTKRSEWNNTDPLTLPDENWMYPSCCNECHMTIVRPVRYKLRFSGLDEKEYEEMLSKVQKMNMKELQEFIEKEDEKQLKSHRCSSKEKRLETFKNKKEALC